MEYQFTKGIQRPNAARLSLALSSVLQDSGSPKGNVRGRKPYGGPHPTKVSSSLTVPTKTPHTVVTTGSMYSQDSWDGPEALGFTNRKPTPSPLSSVSLASSSSIFVEGKKKVAFAGPEAIGDSRNALSAGSFDSPRPAPRYNPSSSSLTPPSSFYLTPSRDSGSSSSTMSSSGRASSFTTAASSQSTFPSLGSVTESEVSMVGAGGDSGKKEKKPRSGFAARLTRLFSPRSSTKSSSSKGTPPSSGTVDKRSSPKAPLDLSVATARDTSPNPFPIHSRSTTPIITSSPSNTHKRNGSTPDAKQPLLSIDIRRSRVKRSSSVSSPLGIPSPTLLARTNILQQRSEYMSIRGRDAPFPLNSSTLSLPLLGVPSQQRARTISQSSVASADTQGTGSMAVLKHSQQNQPLLPIPRMPSYMSLGARRTPPPDGPPPLAPVPAPASTHSSLPKPFQRPRSKSVREPERNRSIGDFGRNEPLPQQRPLVAAATGGDHSEPRGVPDNLSSIIYDSPTVASAPLVTTGIEQAKYGTVRPAQGVQVVSPAPSRPSMRAAFLLGRSQEQVAVEEVSQQPSIIRSRSRAGSVRDFVFGMGSRSLVNLSQSTTTKPVVKKADSVPVPLPPSVIGGLSERGPRSRTGSIKSSRDPSPAQSTSQRPPIPTLPLQNLPERHSNNTHHLLPRSPSLPSLRPQFADASKLPPLPAPRANSHYVESLKTHPETMHIRSPSLPNFPSIDGASRQPLPPSVAQRLRSRSVSKNAEPQPPSSLKNSQEERKSTADTTLPSGNSAYGSPPSLQSPPSPTISKLLKMRSLKRPRAGSLKSPSMPDIRLAADAQGSSNGKNQNQNQTWRPSSPPPPLPKPRATTPPTGRAASIVSNSTRPASPPLTTRFLRSKPNLTRPKELSYPLASNNPTNNQFQARSNKVLAEEGGWDFLDAPPRPPRSPSVRIPETPIVRERSQSFTRMRGGDDGGVVPPMPESESYQWSGESAQRWAVGEAL